ncbi:unnamed protein product, partial [Durusdinium trenchii]
MGFHGAWLQGFRRWVLVPPDERPPFGCRSAPCDDDSDRTSTSGSSAPRGPTDRRVEHVVTWVTRKLGTCRSKKVARPGLDEQRESDGPFGPREQ